MNWWQINSVCSAQQYTNVPFYRKRKILQMLNNTEVERMRRYGIKLEGNKSLNFKKIKKKTCCCCLSQNILAL